MLNLPIVRRLEPLALWIVFRALCVATVLIAAHLDPPLASDDSVDTLTRFEAGSSESEKFYADWPTTFDGEPKWCAPLIRWDSLWYLSIVEEGYIYDQAVTDGQNVVFFPVYPLLIKAVTCLGISSPVAALLVSNAAFLATAFLLFYLVQRLYGRPAARWTLIFWFVYPYSLYGNLAYTESVAALLVVFWLGQLLKGRYTIAGALAGIASGVRPQGILLGTGLLKGVWSEKRNRALVGMMFAGVGLGAYAFYLYWNWNNPLLFIEAQDAWRPSENSTWNPLKWLLLILEGCWEALSLLLHGDLRFFNSSSLLSALWAIVWLPFVWKKMGWHIALTCLAMWVLPLTTGSLISLGRFSWIIIPLFIASGQRLSESRWRWFWLAMFFPAMIGRAALYGSAWAI